MVLPGEPMTEFKTIDDLAVKGKRVLVRADLNVPIREGRISDATRIERTAPGLAELAGKGAKVIVLSHLGRPGGRKDEGLSLKPVADALGRALGGKSVAFAADCIGGEAEAVVAAMKEGDVALLENLRFHGEEEKNDAAFAGKLAALADVYVNDAFSAAHRAHASTEAVAQLLPSAAGRLMQAELDTLDKVLSDPDRPVAAVVGGAKISTKMGVLGNLLDKMDQLIIGGAMANTFLHARGLDVGASLCEPDMAETARGIEAAARAAGCEMVLPCDAVVARELKEGASCKTVPVDSVPSDAMILDVGPAAVSDLKERLQGCRTLLWNGPLGAFEISPFDAGTTEVARAAARMSAGGGLLSVAGGGDTVAALVRAGVVDDFSYVTTAGGAFLEWLEGKILPGVAALGGQSGG